METRLTPEQAARIRQKAAEVITDTARYPLGAVASDVKFLLQSLELLEWSGAKLASRAGIDRATINRFLRGLRPRLSARTSERVMDALRAGFKEQAPSGQMTPGVYNFLALNALVNGQPAPMLEPPHIAGLKAEISLRDQEMFLLKQKVELQAELITRLQELTEAYDSAVKEKDEQLIKLQSEVNNLRLAYGSWVEAAELTHERFQSLREKVARAEGNK